jgi:hypothetical protein
MQPNPRPQGVAWFIETDRSPAGEPIGRLWIPGEFEPRKYPVLRRLAVESAEANGYELEDVPDAA